MVAGPVACQHGVNLREEAAMSSVRERIRRLVESTSGPGLLGYATIAVLIAGVVIVAFVLFGPGTERVLQTHSQGV